MGAINIEIKNKIASLVDEAAFIVCGNSTYVIDFAFDAEWSAYADKTARFIFNGKHIDITFNGNSCEVPIIANAREVLVGVIAGELSTTTPARIECKKSVACDDVAGTKTEGVIPINSSHTHENKKLLDELNAENVQALDKLSVEHIAPFGEVLKVDGKYVWTTDCGKVIDNIEIDETTGDITIFTRIVQNRLIPLEETKIKQSYKMSEIEDDVGYVKVNPNSGGLIVNGEDFDLGIDEVAKEVEGLSQASHAHENQTTLDKFTSQELGAYDNPQFDGVFLWTMLHGYLLTDPEIDEETGDITLKYKTVPNDNIPPSSITIKQNYPEIWTAIEEIRGGIDEIETLIDESGVLE